jgi:hypothetical protein
MNVPREANVPVDTVEEPEFELSIVTQSYGTPIVSATILGVHRSGALTDVDGAGELVDAPSRLSSRTALP